MQLRRPLYKGLFNKSKSKQCPVNLREQYRVKKKENLKKHSSLKLKGIDILYINLGWLINEKSCTILHILFCNRY